MPEDFARPLRQLAAINPDIVSCQIGAWTGTKPGPYDDPSLDPVIQAATGIMARYGGGPGEPALHAIASCADYITGFSSAAGISQALLAWRRAAPGAPLGGARVDRADHLGAGMGSKRAFPFLDRRAPPRRNAHPDPIFAG